VAARVGNDTHTPQGRTPMLPSDNLQVDWFMQTIKMTAFFKRRSGAEAVWKLKVPAGTAAQTLAFRKTHEELNNFCYGVLVEMCTENSTAMMQVRTNFISDPDHWANTLWEALGTRFTQEKASQLQNNLITLGKFSKLPNEDFKEMTDRYKKLISDVRSIDDTQVPSDTNLLAILKESVVTFSNLWAQLEYNTPNINYDKAIDIISRWRVGGVSQNQSTSNAKAVANFMSDKQSCWKK